MVMLRQTMAMRWAELEQFGLADAVSAQERQFLRIVFYMGALQMWIEINEAIENERAELKATNARLAELGKEAFAVITDDGP